MFWVNKEIVGRLVQRFTLATKQELPVPWVLSNFIWPVTQVDELLRVPKFKSVNLDLTGSAGTYVPALTCANEKRIKLNRVSRENTTGTTTICVPTDGDVTANTADWIIDTSSTQAFDMYGLVINPGGGCGLKATANVNDSSIWFVVWYEEEDAY